MSALAIIPFLEGLGLTSVLTGAAEGFLGEGAVSTFIGGAGTGIIGSKIADDVDKSIIKLYTDNMPKEVQNGVSNSFSQFIAAANSVNTQDPRYLILESIRQKKQMEQQTQQTQQTQQQQQPQQTQQPQQGKVINTNEGLITTRVPQMTDEGLVINQNLEEELEKSDEVFVKPREPSEINFLNQGITYNSTDISEYNPREIARLVIDTSRELAETRDHITATRNILELNPKRAGLVNKITQFLASKSLPNSEEYLKIASVFNGRNIRYENFGKSFNQATGLIEISGIDELGNKYTLPQTTGLILPTVSADLVFMGPCSRNDDLPNKERVEDHYAFFHDYDYQFSYFSRIGDLKFISRLSTALLDGKVLPENVNLVQNTIIYFSNVSLTIGLLKGEQKLNDTELNEIMKGNDNVVDYDEITSGIFADLDIEQSPELEEQFYNEMMDEMNNYNLTDGLFTTSPNRQIDRILNEITIEI